MIRSYRGRVLQLLLLASILVVNTVPARSFPPTSFRRQQSNAGPQRKPAAELMGTLELGKSIERRIKPGTSHYYTFNAASHHFVRIMVEQRGIDVVVTLIGLDGEKVMEVDSPTGAYWPEQLRIITEKQGDYRLEVRPIDETSQEGLYVIRLEEERPATSDDQVRLANAINGAKALEIGDHLITRDVAGNSEKALEQYEEALSLMRQANDTVGAAVALERLGIVYTSMRQNEKALEVIKESLPVLQQYGCLSSEASGLSNAGGIYNRMGKKKEAIEYLSRAVSIARVAGDVVQEGLALHNAAMTYYSLNRFREALDFYRQARTIWERLKESEIVGSALVGIATVLGELGEEEKKLYYLNEASEVLRAAGSRYAEARALMLIGTDYARRESYGKAIEYYTRALVILRSTSSRELEASTLNSLASIYALTGEKSKARDFCQQAILVCESLGTMQITANETTVAGKIYLVLGDFTTAQKHFLKAIELSKTAGDRWTESKGLIGLANAYAAGGDLAKARSAIEDAIVLGESVGSDIASPELRATFLINFERLYPLAIDILMRLALLNPDAGYEALAFQSSERARARTLVETLEQGQVDVSQKVDPALVERERSLRKLIDAKSESQARLGSGPHSNLQAAALNKEIVELLAEYGEIKEQIQAASPKYAAMSDLGTMSLTEIQRDVLDPDTLLVEYALSERRSYLFAVTPNSIESFQLPPKADIERAARQVYDLSRRTISIGGAGRGIDGEYLAAASALSKMLLGPVADALGRKRLVIVGGGILSYVPFGALPVPDSNSTKVGNESPKTNYRPLALDHQIITVPSASTLGVLRREKARRPPAQKSLAVFADPVFGTNDPRVSNTPNSTHNQPTRAVETNNEDDLIRRDPDDEVVRSASDARVLKNGQLPRLPFTRLEAEAICKIAEKEKPFKATGFEASRAVVEQTPLADYRILHFATHAIVNDQHPELTGLIMSLVDEKGKPQNGFIRLYRIYDMKLNADLVVLSACESALGKDLKGEGLAGLARGFLHAGAGSVLASLWRVDDEATAELMKHFYKGMISDRLSAPEALRQAQLMLYRQKKWSHPYYWAGFVLVGDWK